MCYNNAAAGKDPHRVHPRTLALSAPATNPAGEASGAHHGQASQLDCVLSNTHGPVHSQLRSSCAHAALAIARLSQGLCTGTGLGAQTHLPNCGWQRPRKQHEPGCQRRRKYLDQMQRWSHSQGYTHVRVAPCVVADINERNARSDCPCCVIVIHAGSLCMAMAHGGLLAPEMLFDNAGARMCTRGVLGRNEACMCASSGTREHVASSLTSSSPFALRLAMQRRARPAVLGGCARPSRPSATGPAVAAGPSPSHRPGNETADRGISTRCLPASWTPGAAAPAATDAPPRSRLSNGRDCCRMWIGAPLSPVVGCTTDETAPDPRACPGARGELPSALLSLDCGLAGDRGADQGPGREAGSDPLLCEDHSRFRGQRRRVGTGAGCCWVPPVGSWPSARPDPITPIACWKALLPSSTCPPAAMSHTSPAKSYSSWGRQGHTSVRRDCSRHQGKGGGAAP